MAATAGLTALDILGRPGAYDVFHRVGGRLRRVGSPQGTFTCDARNQWWEAEGQAAPTLQGGTITSWARVSVMLLPPAVVTRVRVYV